MLHFYFNATDSAGYQFLVVLFVPTQDGEGFPRWATAAGVLSFRNGKAMIIASPAENRGTVICTGEDSDGNQWGALEIDKVFAEFSRSGGGAYGALQLHTTGTGKTFPDTVVSAQAGPFKWEIQLPSKG